MHRFANCLQKQDGFDTWNIDELETEIRTGLKKSAIAGSSSTASA
jgi:rhamnulokinase